MTFQLPMFELTEEEARILKMAEPFLGLVLEDKTAYLCRAVTNAWIANKGVISAASLLEKISNAVGSDGFATLMEVVPKDIWDQKLYGYEWRIEWIKQLLEYNGFSHI